jgi:hypothetical protein
MRTDDTIAVATAVAPVGMGLQEEIVRVIHDHAKALTETSIKAAVSKFEQELRLSIGQTAISVADFYSMQRLGSELIIHVKLESSK